MHRLFLTLSVLGVLLVHVGGASGGASYRDWLTFNEVTLDGHRRVLSRHDIRPQVASLSPDHKHLAFVPYVSEGVRSRELWVADVRAPRRRLLVQAPGWITSVAWAPSGRTIALWVYSPPPESGADGIWLVEVDGSNLRRAADLDYGGSLEWSANSRQLAYARYEAFGWGWLIGVLDIATGLSRDLAQGGLNPHWSPNGWEVAYEEFCYHCLPAKLRVVSVSTGVSRPLADDGFAPSWSPDGRRIAYLRGTQLWVVRSSGGRARLLARRASGRFWSTNARWIAFTRPDGSTECRESIRVVPANGGRTRRLAIETRRIQPLAWNRTRVLYQATRCFG